MSMQSGRATPFRRNEELERCLAELSNLIAPAEVAALEVAPSRPWPLLWIVGAPRSGTTLMLQWLAASGSIAYPTNLLSRFFAAPAIGARIQRLLCDPALDHRGELADLAIPFDFNSDLGKTRGALAPHEFWYFWRRFLPTVDIEPLGERAPRADWIGLRAASLAVAEVFGRPFACKGMMVQYDLPLALARVPEARVLFVRRDEEANAASLLRARERFFGDRTRWYSARPPGSDDLLPLPPEEQVRAQVRDTNACIDAALAELPPARALEIKYEEFCSHPARTWSRLRALLADCELPEHHPGPLSFACTNP